MTEGTVAQLIIFYLLAAGVVGGAIFTMTRKNPVTAVMSLVGTFFALAALYTTLSAHFLAILQVLVYAGAIMVLFIFVVMILNREEVTPVSLRGLPTRILGVAAGGYLMVLVWMLVHKAPTLARVPAEPPPGFGTVASVGDLLFREFLFPFEAISLLLLVAIVGGVVVSGSARQERAALAAHDRRAEMNKHWSDDEVGEPAETGSGDHGGAATDARGAGGHH